MPCVKNDNYQVFAHTYPYEFSFDPIAIEVEASIQPTACNKITILCCNFINSLQILFHSFIHSYLAARTSQLLSGVSSCVAW